MQTRRRPTLAFLVLLLAGVTYSVISGSGAAQHLPFPKPKCESLGFAVYEKWQKPAGLFPFYEADCKLGYVDARGTVVIPARFDAAGSFYEQLAAVGININGKLMRGFINQAGQFVIGPEFDAAHNFSEGVAGVLLDKKWGYIDREGVVIIPPRFADVTPFYRGLARVRLFTDGGGRNGKWGCIDKKGEFVIPPRYDHIQHFTEEIVVAGVFSNEEWKFGLMSWTGKTIREPELDLIGSFENGVASARHELGKGRLINAGGQLLDNEKYNQALTGFSEGLMAVSVDNRAGYLNQRGEWAIRPRFNGARAFSEGLASVKIGEKFGYIDKTGEVVIDPQFDEAHEFSEGLAQVRIEWRYGFIDRRGVFIIRPRFTSVTPFRGGAALAQVHGDQGYIDKSGEFIRRWGF
jgi:hypothetical protein